MSHLTAELKCPLPGGEVHERENIVKSEGIATCSSTQADQGEALSFPSARDILLEVQQLEIHT
jgi:hypothetical protein